MVSAYFQKLKEKGGSGFHHAQLCACAHAQNNRHSGSQ